MESKDLTLIIFHGWRSSVEKWKRVKGFLEAYNVSSYLFPVPGFDLPLERVYTLKDYATLLYSFQKENPHASVLVHSFGGRVLLLLLSLWGNPGWEKIILLNPAGLTPPRTYPSLPFPVPYFLKKLFYQKILKNPDPLEQDPLLKATYKNVVTEDITSRLPQIKDHLIFLWGKEDKVTPWREALPYLQRLSSFEFYVVRGWGHSPHLTSPDELSKIIVNILER